MGFVCSFENNNNCSIILQTVLALKLASLSRFIKIMNILVLFISLEGRIIRAGPLLDALSYEDLLCRKHRSYN